MKSGVEVQKYSAGFEAEIAKYCTGDPNDRGAATEMELYTKIKYSKMFFDFSRRYFDLRGMKFIEIGCGTATVSAAASLMGADVAATDFVEKSVELSASRWREHGIEGDIFRSDLRDNIAQHRIAAFDFVYCYQVLEHIPREGQFKALANLFSMVAPNGYLFIDTENSLCPYDRHDTRTWLLRYLNKPAHVAMIEKLGKGLNYWEPNISANVQVHDYLSYDELIGAAAVSGFEVVSPFMPHGDKKQMLKVLTGSDWLHDAVLEHIDIERFAPISLLLKKTGLA